MLVCQGLLPTIRHFENRRGEGPGGEVATNVHFIGGHVPNSPLQKRESTGASFLY